MTFRVGMKVVCILNKPWRPQQGLINMPFYKGIYTVAEIRTRKDAVGLLFYELKNPVVEFDDTGNIGEPAFSAEYFRPIVERKTSIEVFQRMLNPSEVEA